MVPVDLHFRDATKLMKAKVANNTILTWMEYFMFVKAKIFYKNWLQLLDKFGPLNVQRLDFTLPKL